MSVFGRLRAAFTSRRLERELDEELGLHLELRTRELIDAGWAPDDAAREARRRFGNLTAIREASREVRGGGWLDALRWDTADAARRLWRRPAFTAAAVITLALGIAATTAVLGVVDAVLLRPLPFADPGRLAQLWEAPAAGGDDARVASYPSYAAWKARATSLAGAAAYFRWSANLVADRPERLTTVRTTGGFFEVLGVAPRLGRLPTIEEEQGGAAVVVLGDAMWRGKLGGDPAIVGRTLRLDGEPATVIGVLPPGVGFPDPRVDLWMPVALAPEQRANRQARFIGVIARLAPGVGLEAARAELATFGDDDAWRPRLAPLADGIVGGARAPLLLLLAAVALLLLIACVNAAQLLLARAAVRRHELALRVALGGTRRRLAAQALIEAALLTAIAAVLGVAAGLWGAAALVGWSPGIPRLDGVPVDARVVGLAVGVTALAALVAGLAPALGTPRPEELAHGARSTPPGRRRELLVVAQLALASLLVAGAALLLGSFARLRAVPPGFDAGGVLTFRVWLPAGRYADGPTQLAFFDALSARVAALPGVVASGAVQDLPLRGNRMGFPIAVDDQPAGDAALRVVTPGYRAALGVRLRAGRDLASTDGALAAPVVLVNESLSRRAPLGHRLRFGDGDWRTVIGVVGDVRHMGLAVDEGPAIYIPLAQKPPWLRWMTYVVRSGADPTALVAPLRAAVAALDPALPIFEVATMASVLDASIAAPRFTAALVAAFALVALALALAGVYGVLSTLVAQRTRELGIHLALGARALDVVWLVARKALIMALAGAALGVAGSLALGRLVAGLLYGVTPGDPATIAAVVAVMTLTALAASVLPARRAARVDVVEVLRGG